jgi:hypothetical protein
MSRTHAPVVCIIHVFILYLFVVFLCIYAFAPALASSQKGCVSRSLYRVSRSLYSVSRSLFSVSRSPAWFRLRNALAGLGLCALSAHKRPITVSKETYYMVSPEKCTCWMLVTCLRALSAQNAPQHARTHTLAIFFFSHTHNIHHHVFFYYYIIFYYPTFQYVFFI